MPVKTHSPLLVAMLLQRTVEHDARVRREAAALVGAAHDVVLLEYAPSGPGPAGVRRKAVLSPRVIGRLPLRLRQAAQSAAFIGAAVRERPDVVHAHDVAMLGPGLAAARLTGARLVYDTHELASGVPYRRGALAALVSALERVAIPRCDAVVTVSDAIAEELGRRHPGAPPPVVVRNACDLPRPHPADPPGGLRRRLRIDDDTPLVLHQGAAAPGRGCEVLVRALAGVPDAHVAFLGGGEPGYLAMLQALAREAGVADRVHLLPGVPLDELLRHTREADVGVALFEPASENYRLTLPNKLFEYLAAGVPVLGGAGTETGRVMAEHGVGWTADPADVASVAANLRRAVESCRDPALLERVRAADEALSWSRERERLLGVYATPLPEPRVTALLVVRNPFTHDARVLRAARVLRETGHRPGVLALRTSLSQPRAGSVDGVPFVRVAPLSWAQRRFAGGAGGGAAGHDGGGSPGPARRAYRALRTLDYYRRAIGVVRRERPALVHCNDFNTMWVGIAAKLLTGSRVVYDSHELWADRNGRWEWRPWLLAAEALFVRAADRVVTVSPALSDKLASRYRIAPPDVVRNVPAAASNGRPRTPATPPVAVYIGQLLAGRGLEQAVDAVARVPELRLRVIGPDGEALLERLRRRAEAAGIADRLEIRPAVEPDGVVAALAGASIGLSLFQPTCLSHQLTLPNKLLEYVSAGVPVLTSDVQASARFVREHGVGEVVPAGDTEAIARGMQRLLDTGSTAAARERLAATARDLSWERERAALRSAYAAAQA